MGDSANDEDYYSLLGVSPDASPAEIKRAYRRKIRDAHPDRNSDPDADALTKRLNKANDVLQDPARRRNHDDELRRARQEAEREASQSADEAMFGDFLRHMADRNAPAEAEADRQRRARQAEAAARAGANQQARAAEARAAQASSERSPDPAPTPAHGRRPVLIGAGALTLIGAVALVGFMVWGQGEEPISQLDPTPPPVGSPSPTDDPPEPLVTVAASTDPLVARSVADQEAVLGLPAGIWVPQVSGKCAGLGEADMLDDASGRLGYPDGSAEAYPEGLTEAQIQAFHEAMASRYGDVLLVREDRDEGLCADRTVWTSLVAERFDSSAEAQAWCDAQGLPDPECDPRQVDEALLNSARLEDFVVSSGIGDATIVVPSAMQVSTEGSGVLFEQPDAGLSVTVSEQSRGQQPMDYQAWRQFVTEQWGEPTDDLPPDDGHFRLSAEFVHDDRSYIYYVGVFPRDGGRVDLLWLYPSSEQDIWGPALERTVTSVRARQ